MSKGKSYKHDPGRKYDNPLLRRVEANTLTKWQKAHFEIIDSKQDGDIATSLIGVLAEVIAPAIKSMDGFDDPDGVGDVMVDAMIALAEMSNNGGKWSVAHNNVIKDATNCAVQITNGMPVAHLAKAVLWSRAVAAV